MSAGSPLDVVRKPPYDRSAMWILRELSRLLVRIAVAVVIASAIAGVKAAASGGGMLHTWRITLIVLGCLMLLLAVGGNRQTGANRRVHARIDHAANFILRMPRVPVTAGGPTLTANAVFVGSALALFALGFLV
jgi:hypothetical protein